MAKICFLLKILPLFFATTYGTEIENEQFVWNKHHDNDEMLNIMMAVNNKCSEITRLYSLPEVDNIDIPKTTANNSKLWVIEFASQEPGPGIHVKGKPEFKYIGNMHGNEVVGRELLLRLMDYMCGIYRGDRKAEGKFDEEHILWLIENTRIHIMPSMNPDGWKIAASSAAGDYQNGVEDWLEGRANSDGVDLNRNFPNLNEIYYRNVNNRRHKNNHLDQHFEMIKQAQANEPGLKLEPETKMVMSWIHSEPFVLSSNMHNGDLVANYPFDETPDGSAHKYTASPDDKTFKYLAKSYSLAHRVMGKKDHAGCDKREKDFKNGITNGAEWYSVPGGMQDYNYLSTNCFEITLELGCDKFPAAKELPSLWKDNIDALFNFMFQSHIGIKGMITLPNELLDQDFVTVIRVREYNAEKYIDHDILATKYGDYFRLLADGRYTVTAILQDKDGKTITSRTTCVDVSNDPIRRVEAKTVDFDFTDSNSGLSCEQMSSDSQDSDSQYRDYYYDVRGFLKKYLNRYMGS
ncbi:carboxypeptidase E-like [Mercenaria mercenaria]|uniref:carboxypeptidase E-like n=1 Tax=Mercenaria mercenaria TaxID=6596 RepID=UPI00234EF9E6|nr:carboxypeptidase E-like [Mercenaria mercenaria]